MTSAPAGKLRRQPRSRLARLIYLGMVGLLTWPAYGTWFPYQGRGRIDPEPDQSAGLIPEPLPIDAAHQPKLAPWPAVRLDGHQRRGVAKDLKRIAELRRFELLVVVVAVDHVHVLLRCDEGRDIPQMVQLIKGALSRKLTVLAGDAPPRSSAGKVLPHHKWWTRQYSFMPVDSQDMLDRLWQDLLVHNEQRNMLCEVVSSREAIPLD